MEEGYQEGIKQISAKRKASFEKVISDGKKQANIEWSKVSFVRLEGKAFERGGVKGGDYFIIFAYHGSQFKIKLDDCTHHPKHGWFIQHGPYWHEANEEGGPAVPDALAELKRAAQTGYAGAQYQLGRKYLLGEDGLKKNP